MREERKDVESVENLRRRLVYRAWHRGTKEMDLIMGRFADANVAAFGMEEIKQFETLLDMQDPELYDWICGRVPVPEDQKTAVLTKLLSR